jgi:hypothetical protein
MFTRKNSSGRIREWSGLCTFDLAADSRTIADMGTSFLERFILGGSSQDPQLQGFM